MTLSHLLLRLNILNRSLFRTLQQLAVNFVHLKDL